MQLCSKGNVFSKNIYFLIFHRYLTYPLKKAASAKARSFIVCLLKVKKKKTKFKKQAIGAKRGFQRYSHWISFIWEIHKFFLISKH